MLELKALLLTILVGLFFLIGIVITKFIKKKKELSLFSTGLAFTVMLGMILFDIIPEISEGLKEVPTNQEWLIIIGFTALGMLLLKGLDLLVPHHHHEHHENEKNKKEHNEHLFHVGFVTCLSLMLHNCLEGISIYVTGITDFKLGLMMTLAVALHNIPLGIEVGVGLSASQHKKNTKLVSIVLLTLSSFLGAFVLMLFGHELNEVVLASLLCITFGMLIYISLFELLREIWNNRRSKLVYGGIALGVLLTIIMVLV